MKNVSINNLKEYAERMTKPYEIYYNVTFSSKNREWFIKVLEAQAKKVNQSLSSDAISDKKRVKRQNEAKEIIGVYESLEQAEVIKVEME